MSNLLEWPADAAAFVAKAKKDNTIAHVRVEDGNVLFLRESYDAKLKEPVMEPAEDTDPIWFGLPHVGPEGMPKYNAEGKIEGYVPLEKIGDVPVRMLCPDFPTGCGVYLRLSAYDPENVAVAAPFDPLAKGEATKDVLTGKEKVTSPAMPGVPVSTTKKGNG